MMKTILVVFLSILLVTGAAFAEDSNTFNFPYRDGGKTTSFPLRMLDRPWMTASLVDYSKLPLDSEGRTVYPKDAMFDIPADGQEHAVTLYGVAWMGDGYRCTLQTKWKAHNQSALKEIKSKHPKAQPDLVFMARPTELNCTKLLFSTEKKGEEVDLVKQAPVSGQIFMMSGTNAANLNIRGDQRVMVNGIEYLRVNAISLFIVFRPSQKDSVPSIVEN